MALRGKVILSQLNFFQLAYTSMFSIDNYMYGKNQVLIKKKKPNKKRKTCFPALFSEGWANQELLSLSARCFFLF